MGKSVVFNGVVSAILIPLWKNVAYDQAFGGLSPTNLPQNLVAVTTFLEGRKYMEGWLFREV